MHGKNSAPPPEACPTYIVFDRKSGEIIGTYAIHEALTGRQGLRPRAEVLELFSGLLGDRKLEDVDVLETNLSPSRPRNDLRVDVKAHCLAPMHKLQIEIPSREIRGDGQDGLELTIRLIDDQGQMIQDFAGDLVVTTTRGRLSVPRGRVKAEHGVARLKLTSTCETVERVRVSVRDPLGTCAGDTVLVAFI